jgi:hypothetical protein
MNQGDEGVGLAAPVLGTEPDDRGDLATFARQAQADGLEQLLHSTRRVALGEERAGSR